MGIKRFIRTELVEKLPTKYRLGIERRYLHYRYSGNDHIGIDVKMLKSLCDPQKNTFDVGANVGEFTLFLCKFSSHVYCFEPLSELCAYLRERFRGCNVSIENCALGDVNDVMCLSTPFIGNMEFNTRSSLIMDFRNEYCKEGEITKVERAEVNVKRLDDFNIGNIGFIKIDVEGFEFRVLKGAEETIKKNRPNMFIEIEQRHHKDDIRNIFQYITNLGYFGYFICNKKLTRIEEFDVDKMQNQNSTNSVYINNFIFTPLRFTQ